MDWRKLNPRVIAEFRQNAGKVSGFEGLPLILLQTKGARSGNRFDVPLIPVLEDTRIFLFGTNAGSPKQPIWALNVLAHPRIVVEYDGRVFDAIIEPLSSVDASARLAQRAQGSEQLQQYLANAAPRVVPVFEVCELD
ncbi:MAG: nitroreductase family deazaflavin-dependent oxidoreductase [Gammaproteobacteria bacterium]|jgi:deazaflavin-dependent oxidoreductase (nitroreductase family)|nr:nitroreductase family deazaflavin-dependent oxidoreductase [Gammaproteobacteria bacterium]